MKVYKPTTPGAWPCLLRFAGVVAPGRARAANAGRSLHVQPVVRAARVPRARGDAAGGAVEGRAVQAADGGAA